MLPAPSPYLHLFLLILCANRVCIFSSSFSHGVRCGILSWLRRLCSIYTFSTSDCIRYHYRRPIITERRTDPWLSLFEDLLTADRLDEVTWHVCVLDNMLAQAVSAATSSTIRHVRVIETLSIPVNQSINQSSVGLVPGLLRASLTRLYNSKM